MEPIETTYKGYRFRSRLEARWAVFFDALGVKWQYEPQGYVLESGEPYLPDFYLPKQGMWVEVKGGKPDEGAVAKAKLLCKATEKEVLILVEPPGFRKVWSDEITNHKHVLDPSDPMLETLVTLRVRLDVTPEAFTEAAKKARSARFEHGETPTV